MGIGVIPGVRAATTAEVRNQWSCTSAFVCLHGLESNNFTPSFPYGVRHTLQNRIMWRNASEWLRTCVENVSETWNLTSVFLYRHPLWAFSSNDLRVSISTTDTCGYCTGTQNGADRLHDRLARSSTYMLILDVSGCRDSVVGIATMPRAGLSTCIVFILYTGILFYLTTRIIQTVSRDGRQHSVRHCSNLPWDEVHAF